MNRNAESSQTLLYMGLSPALVEKLLQSNLCPEAKLVLMTMCHRNITELKTQFLSRKVNMLDYEIDVARAVLSAERININRHPQMITLSHEWKEAVETNARIQRGIASTSSINADDDQSSNSEGGPSED